MRTDHETASVVYEHHDLPWRRKPGYTSTFDEFTHARAHIVEIWRETDWNPWRTPGLAPQLERAERVDDEWECEDPDWRPLTKRQMGARMAAITRRVKADSKKREARWEQDKDRYDPEREKGRYALLEREAAQPHREAEVADLRSGVRFPGMPADKRAAQAAELEDKRARNAAEIERLSEIVGDPEDVVDEHGRLPRDRRTWNLIDYRYRRIQQVDALRESIAKNNETLATVKDRSEKSSLTSRLHFDERHLQVLLVVPRLEAEEMCGDCATPAFQHVSGGDLYESRPCPHWPLYAARMKQAWEILRSATERTQAPTPVQPKPEPLETLPGNLAIGDVIERLKELQEKHPDAVVKRGRSNRWELWPAET